MSHIFDALQRSEAERSGAKPSVVATVTELLERAERQALSQWEEESISANAGKQGLSEDGLGPTSAAIDEGCAKETFGSSEAARDAVRAKVFSQFESIETPLPASNRLVSVTDNDSPAAEAFRLLKVRLRRLRKDGALKKVLITSTVPQEGKSFAAANLACTLARGSEERILLVEGDLRRPALSRLFGVTAKPGICEYLRAERTLASSIYSLKEAGIWFLPAGSTESDPLEIVQSTKLPSLMEQFAEWFDWIIIDSPPVLPLADTTAWVRIADGVLVVTRRDVTEKRKLKKGLEAFESEKLIGALLNSSRSLNASDYYYYHGETKKSRGLKEIPG